jgi:hypothetical protein
MFTHAEHTLPILLACYCAVKNIYSIFFCRMLSVILKAYFFVFSKTCTVKYTQKDLGNYRWQMGSPKRKKPLNDDQYENILILYNSPQV